MEEGGAQHLVALATGVVLEGVHDALEQGYGDQAVLVVLPDHLGRPRHLPCTKARYESFSILVISMTPLSTVIGSENGVSCRFRKTI